MPVCRKLLKFGHLDRDVVVASDEEGRLEVAAAVGHQLLRHVGAGVGDLHGGARQHAVLVAHRSRDLPARLLSFCAPRKAQAEQDRSNAKHLLHGTSLHGHPPVGPAPVPASFG